MFINGRAVMWFKQLIPIKCTKLVNFYQCISHKMFGRDREIRFPVPPVRSKSVYLLAIPSHVNGR